MIRRVQPSSYKPTEVDWAYLAGFIDGEGCISTTYTGQVTSHHARLVIAQAHHASLQSIAEKFGVGRLCTKRAGAATHHEQLVWGVTKREELIWLLKGVLPYLVLKRTQAMLAIKLCHRPDKATQAKLARQLKLLKKKGLGDES